MDIEHDIEVLRSDLLQMSRLSQRAVDYSIKAYQLGRPEFCQHVCNTEQDLRRLQRSIAERGHTLLADGLPVDSHSCLASFALRICSALDITYTAATGIAQNTMLHLEDGRVAGSPALEEMGHLVNSLVRLCTVALFKEEVQHAKTVLQNDGTGQWFDLAAYQAHSDPTQRTSAQARFELAISKSLGQIAEQAHEIADAIAFLLVGKDCIGATHQRAA